MKNTVANIDDIVEINNLPKISVPFTYDRDGKPHPEGLYSVEIFGYLGSDQRQTQYAYCDLKKPFFHPVIYHNLISSFKFINDILSKTKDADITEEGYVKPVDAGKGIGTGIDFFYENWEKLKWPGGSPAREKLKDLLGLVEKNRIFCTKWLILPPFFRDMAHSAKDEIASKDEFTKLYTQLIGATSLLDDSDIFGGGLSETRIQMLLLEIHILFTSQEGGKRGVIHRKLLGKSIDYPARTVISGSPVESDSWDTQQIPMGYIGIPLHIAAGMFYPFVKNQIHELFFTQFKNDAIYLMDNEDDITIDEETIETLSDDFIDKLLKRYASSVESRLDRVILKNKDGEFVLKALEDILGRPFTLMDLIYMATSKAIEDKYSMSTRYPLEDFRNIQSIQVRLIVTEETRYLEMLDIQDNHYPKIPADLDYKKVKWVDSVRVNNAYLDGWGGDFDGSVNRNIVSIYY